MGRSFKRSKEQLDIFNPNLDEFLMASLLSLTQEQRERIPAYYRALIFPRARITIDKLKFFDKMYLLTTVFHKRFYCVVEDERSPITWEMYQAALAVAIGKMNEVELGEKMQAKGAFVFGPTEVVDSYNYLRLLSCTDIFRVVQKGARVARGQKGYNFIAWQNAARVLCKTFLNYEIHRKQHLFVHNFDTPELYALMYFYHGERAQKDFVASEIQGAEGGHRVRLGGAVQKLIRMNYLARRGKPRSYLCSLTPEGKRAIDEFLVKTISTVT